MTISLYFIETIKWGKQLKRLQICNNKAVFKLSSKKKKKKRCWDKQKKKQN